LAKQTLVRHIDLHVQDLGRLSRPTTQCGSRNPVLHHVRYGIRQCRTLIIIVVTIAAGLSFFNLI
jgi:hypothetical protein